MRSNEYNTLVKKVIDDDGWFEPFMLLVKAYYADNCAGGSLHIVLDDGNLEDGHVSWCAGYAAGADDERGSEIGNMMRMMTMPQRERVYESYDEYA